MYRHHLYTHLVPASTFGWYRNSKLNHPPHGHVHCSSKHNPCSTFWCWPTISDQWSSCQSVIHNPRPSVSLLLTFLLNVVSYELILHIDVLCLYMEDWVRHRWDHTVIGTAESQVFCALLPSLSPSMKATMLPCQLHLWHTQLPLLTPLCTPGV